MINSRTKGHAFERELATWFREIGFEYCKTTRAASKLMDDCGIDFVGIPFRVQAKSGYATNRPKFEDVANYSKQRLLLNFPKEHPIHNIPFILVHKLDTKKGKRTENDTFVSISKDSFEQLLRMAYPELIKQSHV